MRAHADPTSLQDHAPAYILSRHDTVAFLMPHASGVLRALPRLPEVEALEALHQLEIGDCLGLPTSRVIGWVALVHPEKAVVDRDLAGLHRLECDRRHAIDPA